MTRDNHFSTPNCTDLDNNPSLHDVLAARMHRRHVLKGGVGAMTMAGLGALGLTAPVGAEVTGLTESPDGKALFVNIQHPGENTTNAQFMTKIFESNWPGNGMGTAAYGPGGASSRPRSATIVITKNDGGVIGL